MKIYKVHIKVVSPVHVGTGEVFEPTTFFVNEKEGYLGEIDFDRFFNHFSDEDVSRFKNLCLEGSVASLVKLYDFVDNLTLKLLDKGIDGFVMRKMELCKGFLSHYKKVKSLVKGRSPAGDLHREFNRFTIYRVAFSPNERQPILPGSAVKGAVRTAVLNLKKSTVKGKSANDYYEKRGSYNSKKLESEILKYDPKKINQDPFRLVKFSDFKPVGEVNTRVVYAVNRKRDGERARGPYQILEVIKPESLFEGEIAFLEPQKDSGIKKPMVYEDVINALEAFYQKEQEHEKEILQHVGAGVPMFPVSGLPLRLGRHSGAECVTIEGFRQIAIRGRGGQKRYEDKPTTLWLASEEPSPHAISTLSPFGWVEVKLFTEREYIQKFGRQRNIKETSIEVNFVPSDDTKRKGGFKKIEERKEDKYDGLSKYKRMVLKIQDPSTDGNTIMDYFRQIDQLGDEEQREIAAALKERWQGEGRWKVAQKKKQYQKVQKIKEILGDKLFEGGR